MDLNSLPTDVLEKIANGDLESLPTDVLEQLAGANKPKAQAAPAPTPAAPAGTAPAAPVPSAPTSANGRTPMQGFEHRAQVLQRGALEGLGSGVMGLPALAADVARNAAYGAKKGAAALGVAEAPDPANYGLEGGYFPTVKKATDLASSIVDQAGIGGRPENTTEKWAQGLTSGAFSGAGSGAAGGVLSRAPWLLGRLGRVFGTNLGSQAAAGTAAAAASRGTESLGGDAPSQAGAGVGAGALTAMALSRGRRATGITSEADRDVIAGDVLRRNLLPPGANVERTVREATNPPDISTEGFRLSPMAALQEERMARTEPLLRQWSQGENDILRQSQSGAVRNRLEARGGTEGTGAATRRGVEERGASDLSAMDLQALPPTETTSVVQEALRNSRLGRNTGRQTPTAEAAQQVRDDMFRGNRTRETLRPGPEPGTFVGTGQYRTYPSDLAAVRGELSAARNRGGVLGQEPMTKQARVATGGIKDEMDVVLDRATGGQWGDYLTRYRQGKGVADRQEFMEALLAKGAGTDPRGTLDFNRVRSILENPNASVKLPSNNRSMATRDLDRLSPEDAAGLRGVSTDMRRAQFGEGGSMRNVRDMENLESAIAGGVRGSQGVANRVLSEFLPSASSAATPAGGLLGSYAVPLMARASRPFTEAARGRTQEAERSVQSALGVAAYNPDQFARIARLPAPYRPSLLTRGVLGMSRGAMLGGAQGILEETRRSRFR